MSKPYDAMRVAILVADGFEEVEMSSPRAALMREGMQVMLVSPNAEEVQAWNRDDWGGTFQVEVPLIRARADDFHALVLPGGVKNPDELRMIPRAVAFVRDFFEQGKPVAAICHAPWTLIEADVVRGRRMTSYPSLQTDLRNAGAEWVNEEVVVDNGLVTSRHPGDLDAFNQKIVEEIKEGIHAGQHA